MKAKIDKKTLLVNLCHITSNNGNENPAQEIGRIIKSINSKIIYSIDACQSVGHINVDVNKFQCDILIGSGRKFLRGPRGTGFIYLKKIKKKIIEPNIIDSHNSYNTFEIRLKNSHVFENFEYSRALKFGLSESIKKINEIGIKTIEENIKLKTFYLRDKLKSKTNIHFYENINKKSGINTLSFKNNSSQKIQHYLLKKKILTSTVKIKDFFFNKKNKISDALRISFHYYNTYKQIDYLIKCISRI